MLELLLFWLEYSIINFDQTIIIYNQYIYILISGMVILIVLVK
ncbi:hypothetical protein DSUL_40085 [Desulfovibrionales bacterium]